VLQCVAVCCSVLQCVAVCCSVLQCVAVCCSVLQCVAVCCSPLISVASLFLQESSIFTKLCSRKEFHHGISANSGSTSQTSRSIQSSRLHCVYYFFQTHRVLSDELGGLSG